MGGWGQVPDPWVDQRVRQPDPVAQRAADESRWAVDIVGQELASHRAQEFRGHGGAFRQAEFYGQLQAEAAAVLDMHQRNAALSAGWVPSSASIDAAQVQPPATIAPQFTRSAPDLPAPSRQVHRTPIGKVWRIATFLAFVPCMMAWGVASGRINRPDPSTGGASVADFVIGFVIAGLVGAVVAAMYRSRQRA